MRKDRREEVPSTASDDMFAPGSPSRMSTTDAILRIAIGVVVVLVVAAAVLIVRDIPRAGEAPTTAAQAAIDKAMAGVEEDPSSVMARLQLADAYFQHRLYEDALTALDDAQSLEPTSTMAAYVEVGYGRVYEAMGEMASAVEHYEASLELDRSFDALFGLGNAASADGRPQDAVDFWLEALTISPGAATLRVEVAEEYEVLGQYDLALEQLQEAAKYLPNDPAITAAIARVQPLATQP